MKKIVIVSISFCLVAIFFLLGSCGKDDYTPDNPPSNNPASAVGFTWTANGNTVKADSGFFITAFNNIIAYKNGASVDIILSSLNVGTYSISSATGNTLDYKDNSGNVYSAVHGTVNISSVENNKMSGSFSAAFSNSMVANISGEFNNVPSK